MANILFGGIEAGGTKFVCGISDQPGTIKNQISFPTTTPDETMAKVIAYFNEFNRENTLAAIGVCSFGPIDSNPHSVDYGRITTTPKPSWNNFNFVACLKKAFDVPIGFDTDVNGAALGEYYWGNGQRVDNLMYWTVGTGIGVGILLNGKPIGGYLHPEAGHMFVYQDKIKDPFKGICPFHGHCLEGLASGPALHQRWKVDSLSELHPEHEAWHLEAEYLGLMLANVIMTLSPKKIIVGGGVMQVKNLHDKVRRQTLEKLNGYMDFIKEIDIDNYIVPPGLGNGSGLHGAIALAKATLYR